jgi:hypothetical protein
MLVVIFQLKKSRWRGDATSELLSSLQRMGLTATHQLDIIKHVCDSDAPSARVWLAWLSLAHPATL